MRVLIIPDGCACALDLMSERSVSRAFGLHACYVPVEGSWQLAVRLRIACIVLHLRPAHLERRLLHLQGHHGPRQEHCTMRNA